MIKNMNNSQKGFIVPLLILIIVLLVVAGGVYIYNNKKAGAPAAVDVQTPLVDVKTNNLISQTDTLNWKTYSGVNFSFKYPSAWYLNTSSPGSMTITNYDSSLVPGSDAPISKDNIAISISIYNSLSVSETVELWVSKIGLSDKRNILVDGVKAIRGRIIYTGQEESGYYQKGESSGDYIRFIYNGKGYQITYSPYGSKFISTFDKILSTFKFIKSDLVSTSQPTKKIICTLSGNTIDDSQNQNGLTFFAQGQSCATASGFLVGNNSTSQSVTFNGMTKTWRMVLLSFYMAHFSPDGEHFAYAASNLPLPAIVPGGDWKPQRFIVSDNVEGPTYDDVYYPQYSQDGKHLAYCAYQGGQYMKIIDGIKTITTKDYYFTNCDSLFGFKQGLYTDHSQTSQGEISSNGAYTITQNECSAKWGCQEIVLKNNTTGISAKYPEVGEIASNVKFSSDSNHFTWLLGNSIYIDGTLDTYTKSQNYNEVFNIAFSADSKSITYNARLGKNVYYIVEPIKQAN